MTETRKKYIHQYFTELYRMYVQYIDLNNAAPDMPEQVGEFMDKCNNLMTDLVSQGARMDDITVMRKMNTVMLDAIAQLSVARAQYYEAS